MRLLLLGKDGQVGWELQRSLAPLGELIACGHSGANLENVNGLRRTIRNAQPAIIVNAAAYTAVDKAESEPERAYRVNAEAVGVLAEEATHLGAWLVHYSTDYVFDGVKGSAYTEDDVPNPINVYGRTKLAGEHLIRQSGCRYLIFRTSWVYAARGSNFAKTILRLAGERDKLKVVADQVGAPTSAELIADVTALCMSHIASDSDNNGRLSGTYHLVAGGETSWHGYARFVIDKAIGKGVYLKLRADAIEPIPTTDYPLPARRPLNSRLSTQKLRATFKLNLPDWRAHMDRMLDETVTQEVR